MTEPSPWASLLPGSASPMSTVGASPERDKFVSGLRELADLIETRTDLPVPRYGTVGLSVYDEGTDEQKRAQVDYASTLMEAPVKDEAERGGHYLTGLSFGPVCYQVISIPGECKYPDFSPGQEVQLTADEARMAARGGKAQVGIVVGRIGTQSQPPYYKIRVPGWNGMMDVPATSLEPAEPLGPVYLSAGPVSTIEAAEAAIIGAGARIKIAGLRGLPPDDLDQADLRIAASALGWVCGLSDSEVIRQLQPQIAARAQDVSPSNGAAGLAAADVATAPRREKPGKQKPASRPRPGRVPSARQSRS